MTQETVLYRIQFINNGKQYQLFVRELSMSSLYGFVEIGDFVFDNQSAILVDPSEEKLKTEFASVDRSYIPMHSVVRIDAVKEKGTATISELNGNVVPFPYFPGK